METLPVRVLVADDHQVVRAGIRSYLALPARGIRFVVEEAETVEEAMASVYSADYDVVLMDYEIPKEGGPWATERILTAKPFIRVLALSIYENRSHVRRMKQAGARGYLLKSTGPETLVSAIRAVLNGKPYYSNEIYAHWVGADFSTEGHGDPLTEREREVLKLIAQGYRESEIAQQMYISPGTVGKHREHIRMKVHAHNTAELVLAAQRLGLTVM